MNGIGAALLFFCSWIGIIGSLYWAFGHVSKRTHAIVLILLTLAITLTTYD